MNESGRGAWHRSIQAQQRRIFKTEAEFKQLDPRPAPFAPRGSYLGSALGAVAFPGDASRRDEARGGQEKAPDLDHALPILREPPSRRLRPAEVQ